MGSSSYYLDTSGNVVANSVTTTGVNINNWAVNQNTAGSLCFVNNTLTNLNFPGPSYCISPNTGVLQLTNPAYQISCVVGGVTTWLCINPSGAIATTTNNPAYTNISFLGLAGTQAPFGPQGLPSAKYILFNNTTPSYVLNPYTNPPSVSGGYVYPSTTLPSTSLYSFQIIFNGSAIMILSSNIGYFGVTTPGTLSGAVAYGFNWTLTRVL